jgi:hypothetical protein
MMIRVTVAGAALNGESTMMPELCTNREDEEALDSVGCGAGAARIRPLRSKFDLINNSLAAQGVNRLSGLIPGINQFSPGSEVPGITPEYEGVLRKGNSQLTVSVRRQGNAANGGGIVALDLPSGRNQRSVRRHGICDGIHGVLGTTLVAAIRHRRCKANQTI